MKVSVISFHLEFTSGNVCVTKIFRKILIAHNKKNIKVYIMLLRSSSTLQNWHMTTCLLKLPSPMLNNSKLNSASNSQFSITFLSHSFCTFSFTNLKWIIIYQVYFSEINPWLHLILNYNPSTFYVVNVHNLYIYIFSSLNPHW